MDLNWSKQIHTLNKYIADWKWKSITNKVDPAQLRASYVEFLLPRLEIGLLHANITEKMCNAWTSSIIYTFSKRGGIPNGHSLNRMAFCLLAGIPDLWLHLNTIRATDLLCFLNSKNSAAGLSTVARFCALTGTADLPSAVKALEDRTRFSRTNTYRISSTLRYLKQLDVKVVSPSTQPSLNTARVTQEIKSVLSDLKCKAIIYTDGSTSTRGKPFNSGCGIFITNEQNQPLWSGGFTVRADGNNFIAELAAAAVVLNACPAGTDLLLRTDSMATIGALSKGIVSERKRIRAPGRAWLNFCRAEIAQKRISIEHVFSHTDQQTPEQKGNDAADALANKYRLEGESVGPVPYIVSTEEPLILQFQGSNVQGDPRKFLKQLEKERMADIWRTKGKDKQAAWFIKHPTQVLKQAKLVWKWSVESGTGRAWLFFIFGVCQWLPTNYRINYHTDDRFKKCSLCLSGAEETMDHLLCCPALVEEQVYLKQIAKSSFSYWNIPYSTLPFISRGHGLRRIWTSAARENLALEDISSSRLDILTNAFWKANQSKPFIPTRSFLESLSEVLDNRVLSPFSNLLPRQDLLSVLIQEFSLQTHGLTDSLHSSPLFGDWNSLSPTDLPFGAKLWSEPKNLFGSNAFFFHGPNDKISTHGLLTVLAESLATSLPTRFVCLVPRQELLPSHFLELAVLHAGLPLFGFPGDERCLSNCSMSLILAANKESLQVDPINWERFVNRLHEWGSSDLISIPELTDTLFRERVSLLHSPRPLSKHPESVVLNSTPLINFYDAFAPTERSQNVGSIPPRAAELIAQMNRHPRFLSLLGILPNQFRTLLKESNHENREEAILDLSRTLFFAGFRIWNRRQKLASRFWKDIAPENRNVIGLNSNKGKKKNKDNTAHQMTKCKNPFHFLRRYRNLSNKRETRCPCSKAPKETKDMPNHRITRFLCMTTMPIKSPSESTFIQSRTDKIRAQHDRGKKRKGSKLQRLEQSKKKSVDNKSQIT